MDRDGVVERLRDLFEGRGNDRIFARMTVRRSPDLAESIKTRSSAIAPDTVPTAEQLFPLWEEALTVCAAVEDDSLPCIYPRRFDQGLYGAVFGLPVMIDPVDGPGWFCSMTRPVEDLSYPELVELAGHPDDSWLRRAEDDIRYYAQRGAGRFGVGVPITVDALNLAMQIRGSQALIDIYDRPDELKAFLQAGVGLNITIVKRLRTAIGPQPGGGVCDFFNAGWMPDQGIPMSVDCYNFCHPDLYAEFGQPYQQQLVDHFGSANFHIHGNGLQLLPEVARLNGRIAVYIGNDGSERSALDAVDDLLDEAESLILVIPCGAREFRRRLRDHSLPGGVYYYVGGLEDTGEANRLMEDVRAYRA